MFDVPCLPRLSPSAVNGSGEKVNRKQHHEVKVAHKSKLSDKTVMQESWQTGGAVLLHDWELQDSAARKWALHFCLWSNFSFPTCILYDASMFLFYVWIILSTNSKIRKATKSPWSLLFVGPHLCCFLTIQIRSSCWECPHHVQMELDHYMYIIHV